MICLGVPRGLERCREGGAGGGHNGGVDYQYQSRRLPGQSPRTWADLIRQEGLRRGRLTTADERQRWKGVLEGFSRQQRTAFAAAAAQSLLRSREAVWLAGDYVLGWRPVLEGVWRGLEGDDG